MIPNCSLYVQISSLSPVNAPGIDGKTRIGVASFLDVISSKINTVFQTVVQFLRAVGKVRCFEICKITTCSSNDLLI